MILAATLLWAVEIVFVKRLLRGLTPSLLAAARMGFGTALLLALGRGLRPLERLAGLGCRAVAVDPPHGAAAHRLRRHLVCGARAGAGDRRDGGARLRRIRDRSCSSGAIDGKAVSATGMALVAAGAVVAAAAALRRPAPESASTVTAGPLLFARYAYPPNALGLCGADVRRTLLEYGAAGESDGGLAELARTFEGAWPYLELIAGANGIYDPLDPRVVEAYWVGNDLLGHVTARFTGSPCRRPFPGPARAHPGARLRRRRRRRHAAPLLSRLRRLPVARSPAHWSVDEPLRILDLCRTTPARVLSGER